MNPEPSSIILNPQTFDAAERILTLRKMLQEETVDPDQRNNITAAITMYCNGELPKPTGELTWFQDGEVSSEDQIHNRTRWWVEGGGIQLMDKPREPTQ